MLDHPDASRSREYAREFRRPERVQESLANFAGGESLEPLHLVAPKDRASQYRAAEPAPLCQLRAFQTDAPDRRPLRGPFVWIRALQNSGQAHQDAHSPYSLFLRALVDRARG